MIYLLTFDIIGWNWLSNDQSRRIHEEGRLVECLGNEVNQPMGWGDDEYCGMLDRDQFYVIRV